MSTEALDFWHLLELEELARREACEREFGAKIYIDGIGSLYGAEKEPSGSRLAGERNSAASFKAGAPIVGQ